MRKIKFRAWDKKNKHMLEIFDSTTNKDWFLPNWNENFEVMQYTGLKDKNGKEIYEGDIVKAFGNHIIEVIYCNAAFGYDFCGSFTAFSNNRSLAWSDGQSERIEIVGNIHKNPELLEVQP